MYIYLWCIRSYPEGKMKGTSFISYTFHRRLELELLCWTNCLMTPFPNFPKVIFVCVMRYVLLKGRETGKVVISDNICTHSNLSVTSWYQIADTWLWSCTDRHVDKKTDKRMERFRQIKGRHTSTRLPVNFCNCRSIQKNIKCSSNWIRPSSESEQWSGGVCLSIPNSLPGRWPLFWRWQGCLDTDHAGPITPVPRPGGPY